MQSQNNQKLLEIKNAEIKFSVEGGIVNAVNDISFDIIKGERIKIKGYLEDFALSRKEADDLIMTARDKIYKN